MPRSITADQIGRYLYTGCRLVAPFLAFLATCLILTADLCYRLGYQLGSAVHARNDQLARLWVNLWVRDPEPVSADPEPQPQPHPQIPPAVHPLLMVAEDLQTLSCAQIRRLTGLKARCSKAQLISLALAMA